MKEVDDKQIEATYRDILGMALAAYSFRHHMSRKLPVYITRFVIGMFIIDPLKHILRAIGLRFNKLQPKYSYYFRKLPNPIDIGTAAYEKFLERYYTAEQRAHPAFECAEAHDQATWCLARLILDRFKLDSIGLESLLTLHRLTFEKFPGQASVRPLNIILAVGAVAANTVPEEAFQALHLEDYYGAFQLVTAAIILYLLFMFTIRLAYKRATQRHSFKFIAFLEEVLQYAVIIHNFSSNGNNGTAHSRNTTKEPIQQGHYLG
jgi:hypothetical protein